jgi:hypothetical protein
MNNEQKTFNFESKEELFNLKNLYNEFTEAGRINNIRTTMDKQIHDVIIDLIISTINDYQDDPTKDLKVIHNRIIELKRLIGVYNDYIKKP